MSISHLTGKIYLKKVNKIIKIHYSELDSFGSSTVPGHLQN